MEANLLCSQRLDLGYGSYPGAVEDLHTLPDVVSPGERGEYLRDDEISATENILEENFEHPAVLPRSYAYLGQVETPGA